MSQHGLNAALADVISLYDLPSPETTKVITEGLIHQTYALHFKDRPALILQRLHPLLNTPDTLADYEAVTEHLAQAGYGGPELVLTRSGARAATDAEGARWRLSTFVPGLTRPHIEDPQQARLAGETLARFHRLMASLEYSFKSPHPGHDTQGHWERLHVASQAPEHQAHWAQVQERGEGILSELGRLILPQGLPRVVVHGDPKVTNIRFQEGRAVLIDLDTCARHTRLVDIGDAIRSWCDLSREGSTTPDGRVFSLERCRAMLEGYLSHSEPLTALEREWLPRCGRTITLELASRFTRDYLEDHYFAYDATRFDSRRAHNLHRIESMWRLAEEMREAEAELVSWLKSR